MTLILPILFCALFLGLCIKRMNAAAWALMVVCIVATVTLFYVQH